MKYPNPDMLLRVAQADAYAAAVEYLEKNPGDNTEVRKQALLFKGYVERPLKDMVAGQYTDDTEMSIANTLVLLGTESAPKPIDFANAYVREFAYGGMRNGYARGFQKFLLVISTGKEFLEHVRPCSDRNGAAMRAVPIGVYAHVPHVLEVAATQARITHDTPAGVLSAQIVALLSHFSLWHEEPFAEIDTFLLAHSRMFAHPSLYRQLHDSLAQPWSGIPVHKKPYGNTALTTVHAVMSLLRNESSLMDILRRTIEWGGDTDSVAAIAWGIASARYQDEVIPEFFVRGLEPGNQIYTGSQRLLRLGSNLMSRFD